MPPPIAKCRPRCPHLRWPVFWSPVFRGQVADHRGVFGSHACWTRRTGFLNESAGRLGRGNGAHGVSMEQRHAHGERHFGGIVRRWGRKSWRTGLIAWGTRLNTSWARPGRTASSNGFARVLEHAYMRCVVATLASLRSSSLTAFNRVGSLLKPERKARTKAPAYPVSSVSFESREACAERAGIKHFFTMTPSVPCLYNWQCHGILRASRLVRKIGSLGVVMGHGPGKASVGRCLLVGQHTCSCKLRDLTLFVGYTDESETRRTKDAQSTFCTGTNQLSFGGKVRKVRTPASHMEPPRAPRELGE